MEHPIPNSSTDISKSFLDNERGDNFENVTNKNTGVKDFITDQSESENKKITGNGDDPVKKSNVNENINEKENLEENKKHNEQDNVISNQTQKEEEIFKGSSSKVINETHTNEEEKFKDIKSEEESFGKDFINNENVNVKGNVEEKDESNQNKTEETANTSGDSQKEEWMDILGSGQLKKRIITAGIPDSRPQKADVCIISIEGKLEDGTVFEKHDSLEINLGDNETVQGIDFALALMDKGEEAEIIIASRFGYGSRGDSPLVPPDATLTYHVTLLDVKPETLINSLNIKERIAIGSRKKERGNWWYARDEHTLAIHSYRRALDYLDDTDIPGEHTDEEVMKLLEERLKTYNNLGMSQMKISAYDAALLSIDQVLNCQPKNVKALFRKSKILKQKGELTKSIEVIREALAIEPDSKAFQQELSLLLAAQRKDNSKQRDLYKKMMGTSVQDNEAEKKKKTPYNSFRWIAAVSFAVAILGAVAFKYRL